MPLRVSLFDGETETLIPMVTFTLDGSDLSAKWEPDSEGMKDMLEVGIVTEDGIAVPSDGKPFYDGLENAFSQSTLIQVQEVPE